MRSKIGAALVATLFWALALVAPAHATFPGTNGKIAGTSYDATDASVDGNVFTLNPDGSGFTFPGATTFFEGLPAWSPDSSKIAYVTNRDGNYEIYIMNPD